jgi:superfamily II DNA/RNA helicase
MPSQRKMELHRGGRRSRTVEEGGAAMSCDEEGRRVVAWEVALGRRRSSWKKKGAPRSPCSRTTEPPAAAAVEEEGRSKFTTPCTGERESCCYCSLTWERDYRRESPMGEKKVTKLVMLLNMCGRRERERKMGPCV